MNKLNYLLVSVIIILLIGNIFLYSNLNKQNSSIKKDISDLKQGQVNQQASQKEAIENLQNLVTFNWTGYANTNENYGFSFKYPDYVSICDATKKFQYLEKAELNLLMITYGKPGDCDNSRLTLPAPMQIVVKKNTNNYKTAKEAFYKEFTFFEKSFNSQLGYFKLAKLDAYGGVAKDKYATSDASAMGSYNTIILKNDYIIKFSSYGYSGVIEGRQGGAKPILDAIISSLYFYQDAKQGF